MTAACRSPTISSRRGRDDDRLGIWQLRARWKEALLALSARRLPPIAFPTAPSQDLPLFRRPADLPAAVTGAPPGRTARARPAISHIVDCRTGAEGPGMAVEIGWSKDPNAGTGWKGGAGQRGDRARQPAAGCGWCRRRGLRRARGRARRRRPTSIPNNHLSYAVQWFLFAGIAALIYALALRKRWRQEDRP